MWRCNGVMPKPSLTLSPSHLIEAEVFAGYLKDLPPAYFLAPLRA